MIDYLRAQVRRHYAFLLLFVLFISYRLLAILLFRPGGFITDFSDYDFYYTWGQLIPMGYRAYDNLWTAYPPLFPAVMLSIFEVSSRIPPWIEPRLFFHVLFGVTLLLFESGSFILLYRLGNRLGDGSEATVPQMLYGVPILPGLIPAVLYALLFVPVYTLIGWFEPMPLFFMLLGLDLLLVNRTWGWIGSAVAAGLGFLTKLTPILLVPIAVRWLGAKLSWRAARDEWFSRRSPGNIGRATAYVAIFFVVVIGLGYPLVRANPQLAFSSFRIQSIRPPWQSLWAILDGFYGYGLVPLDMRNLSGLSNPLWDTRLPWAWIGLAFVAIYLWLYTRRYDWQQPRTPIAFSAISIILLFLYSKGWSPQFLLWILVYIVLLLPNFRGIVAAIVLSLVNFIEANIFLILLPDQHWIMVGTVLTRTALLLLLLVEFASQIWPNRRRGVSAQRMAATATWSVVALAFVAAAFSVPRASQGYQDRRLAEHACAGAVEYLREQAIWPADTIVTQQSEVWRELYPWLRRDYAFRVLDGYSPDQPPETVVLDRLEELQDEMAQREFWWIERSDTPPSPTSPLVARQSYFAQPYVRVLEETAFGACTLYRIANTQDVEPVAEANVAGGPIRLLDVEMGAAQVGGNLPVVLYWQSDGQVEASYTVFAHLLNANGDLIAQQDNLPVQGLAPTNTWEPGTLVRDPYLLDLGNVSETGDYQLVIGLYDASGRRAPLELDDGTTADSVAFPVEVNAS